MKPKISVIVPVYKVEEYLHRCLDSILNQTYKHLEIILVDDESPDNCGDICEDYATKDDRIIVIHQKNQGLSCARNSGLEISTGAYITYVDSDDHLDVTMYEKMMKHVLEHDLEVIEIVPKTNTPKNCDDTLTIEDPVTASKRIISHTAFSVWRRLFKKSIVEDMRFIPGLIHQDVFYTMDLLKRITKNGFLNSTLYYYNTENISIIRSKYTLRKINTGIRATEYIVANVLDDPKLKETIDNYLVYYYTDHYFLLSRNTVLDPDKKYRKKLRKTIRQSLSFNNAAIRSLLVVSLPTKIMQLISTSYKSLKK